MSKKQTEVTGNNNVKQGDTLVTQHFMLEKKATAKDFKTAQEALKEQGIKTCYDPYRMIFSTHHNKKNEFMNIYGQECNGLILELGTWKPLVVPPRSLRFNIDSNASNIFLHKGLYHIYRAEDGTCFNMYYYDNKWIISTAKGYEMNNVVWEAMSYQAIITECLSRLPTPLTWEEFTSKLNTSRCYSFGFKHPNFHRFFESQKTPIYKLWFIQSVDLNEQSPQYLWASDKSPIDDIKGQTYYEENVGSLRDLYKLAAAALDKYVKDGSVCYGFILRSVNFEATGFHSDLFVESSLLISIRKSWYDNKMIDTCQKNNWSKETTVTLNAYLNSELYEDFLHLFPQYQDTFEKYNTKVQEIVQEMIKLQSENNSVDNSLVQQEVRVANILLSGFKSFVKYNLTNKTEDQKRRVFNEFVVNVKNLKVLMSLF